MATRTADVTMGHEVALTNSRGWATVPPPPQPKTVISLPNDRRIISIPGGGLEASGRMSTNNRIIVVMGLAVMGSLGWAAGRNVAHADEPVRPNSSPVITPQAQEERYLLLANGQLVQGVITENESEFLVEQRVGVMRFAKKRVEGAFSSIREAFEYRLAQLPNGDFDEGMKLAFWCLNLKLTSEAKEILTEVVKHNPNNKQAKAMLVSIGQAAARASVRQRDSEVRQTRADEMIDGRPAALDSALLRQARQRLGITDLPVIFDLPAPLAIKRSGEFFQIVHPLLQKYCARCHDGQYDGSFQLVPITNKRDRTPDALRANLDATLRLVDSKAPSHSELLSSTLRPHGRGPRPRPIFTGSNDPTYRILAGWVNSLSTPKTTNDVARADQSPARVKQAEAFAMDRNRGSSDQLNLGTEAVSTDGGRSPLSAGIPVESKIPPPSRIERGRGSIPEGQNSGDPQEFPLPFVISGVKPNIAAPAAVPKAATRPSPKASVGAAVPTPAGPSTTRVGDSAKPSSRADPTPSPDKTQVKCAPGTTKKTSKPLTLDPQLLERALQNRNLNRQKPPAE
jgi:hypothetical protein